ncbi:MAG TPA: SCO family protein [Rudaea sp.]|jgi:protein SCO1/2|uniref:SCO family protein n=1 Tax=Rudaea sp. TaxID=2136325 RepID=UPI002F959FDD
MSTSPKATRPNPTYLILIAALAAAVGLWLGNRYYAAESAPKLASALLYPQPRALPDFHLDQANGQPLTLADWRGHWNIVYFGYTACPDVCPTTLQTLKSAWNELGKRGLHDKIRIDFVSVDPERDTPDVLGKYVSFFSADFVAASGSDEELTKITRALGLVYTRTKNADGNIEVDHSGSAVIVDPQGQLIGIFRPPLAAADVVGDMTTLAGGGR